MSLDLTVFKLFDESNFDAYDSKSDRYPAVLKAGLEQHGLELSDVLAVTHDLGLWAICKPGIFNASLRGVFKKRIEVNNLIPYSRVGSVRIEPSSPHTQRILLTDTDGQALTRIDFSGSGMDHAPEPNDVYANRLFRTIQRATTATTAS